MKSNLNLLSVIVIGGVFASCVFAVPITYTYSWEDGGTILGSSGPLTAENSPAPDNNLSFGPRALKLTDGDDLVTPIAYIAQIDGLQDGDEVSVSLSVWDNSFLSPPSAKLLIRFLTSKNYEDQGTIAAVSDLSTWYKWNTLSLSGQFDSNGGVNKGLLIEVAVFEKENDIIWVDNLKITVPDTASVTIVPEPSTIALFGIGVLALIQKRK